MIKKHKHLSRLFEEVARVVRNDGLNMRSTMAKKAFDSMQRNNVAHTVKCCEFGGIQNTYAGFQFDASIRLEKEVYGNGIKLTVTCPHCDNIIHSREAIQADFWRDK